MGEKMHLIVNTTSRTGKAQAIWQAVKQVLEAEAVEYEAHITQYAGHAGELADEICGMEGKKLLIVLGGDGTLNEVVNGMHDFEQVEMGYIPTGSANDFAKGLGIGAEPVEQMKMILHNSQLKKIDVGEVLLGDGKSRRFVVSAGIGVDADVCLQALTAPIKKVLNKLGLGSLTYGLITVRTMFVMPSVRAKITTAEGWSRKMDNTIFVAAMNLPYEGGGVPMAPRAKADDGRLTAICAYDIPKIKRLPFLVLLLMKKHERLKGVELVDFSEMHIAAEQPLCVHADGEHCGFQKEITYRCLPQLLQMRFPCQTGDKTL